MGESSSKESRREQESSSLSKEVPNDDTETKQQPSPIKYKVVIMGESQVGKSSLAQRYCNNIYKSSIKSTIAVDFFKKQLEEVDDVIVIHSIEFWDVAGQERFSSGSSNMFFRESLMALALFDVNNVKSFQNVVQWIRLFRSTVSLPLLEVSPPIVLVGAKADLLRAEGITDVAIYSLVEEYGLRAYVETSSCQDVGFRELQEAVIGGIRHSLELIDGNRDDVEEDDDLLEIGTISKIETPLVFSKHLVITRQQFIKDVAYIRITTKGIKLEYPFATWGSWFGKKKLFEVHNDTWIKVYEKEHFVIVDNLKQNMPIEFYCINESTLGCVLRELKRMYPTATMRSCTYEYKFFSNSIIDLYRNRCEALKTDPDRNILLLLESISENIQQLDLGMILFNASPTQRMALFETIIWMYSLQFLSLGSNSLNDHDVKELCSCMTHMNHIKMLRMNRNPNITVEGCKYLASLISVNTITGLSMNGCKVNDEGGKLLLLAANNRSTLIELDLSNCSLTNNFMDFLIQLCSKSPFHHLFKLNLNMNSGITAEKIKYCFDNKRDLFRKSNLEIDLLSQYSDNNQILYQGVVFCNQYKVINKLGEGACGAVFKCHDMKDGNRVVAVKRNNKDTDLEDSFKEAMIHAPLKHEFIVNMKYGGVDANMTNSNQQPTIYLIMDYFEHGSLDGVIAGHLRKSFKPMSQYVLSYFLDGMCQALSYLKEQNIVHRDIKPQNILVSEPSTLKCVLSDFGLASKVTTLNPSCFEFCGTPQFIPPEIETIGTSHKGDLFSLGCIMYQLLSLDFNTHVSQLEGSDVNIHKRLKENILVRSSEFDEKFVDLVLKMLARNPDERPNPEDIIKELRHL